MMEIHNSIWAIYDKTYDEIEEFITNFTSEKQLENFKNAQVVATKRY